MGQREKSTLLYICHCYHNRAGVEEHLKTLSAALKGRYQISIVFPENGRICLLSPEQPPLFLPGEQLSILAPLNAPQTRTSLDQVLKIVNPDLVHIIHFVNWPLAMIEQVIQYGKPAVMSFHDYYAVTPHYTMEGESDPTRTTTTDYAKRLFGRDISDYLLQRRELLNTVLGRLKGLAVPSPYLANVLQQIFPYHFDVIEYGIRPFQFDRPASDQQALRFGYLGSLLPQKGWQSLFTAFQKFKLNEQQAELHFFGGAADLPFPSPGIFFHGHYDQPQLPQILEKIDIGVIPSVFAETYSLVLSEMWQAKLPVAVSDIGAMGERVIDGVNGRKFSPGDVEQIGQTLLWFLQDHSWKKWPTPKVRLDHEMADQYDSWYQQLIR